MRYNFICFKLIIFFVDKPQDKQFTNETNQIDVLIKSDSQINPTSTNVNDNANLNKKNECIDEATKFRKRKNYELSPSTSKPSNAILPIDFYNNLKKFKVECFNNSQSSNNLQEVSAIDNEVFNANVR